MFSKGTHIYGYGQIHNQQFNRVSYDAETCVFVQLHQKQISETPDTLQGQRHSI
jgi:hypothetical protein